MWRRMKGVRSEAWNDGIMGSPRLLYGPAVM